MDYEKMALEHEAEADRIEKRIHQLKSNTVKGSKSDQHELNHRLMILEDMLYENRSMARHFRKRAQEELKTDEIRKKSVS